MEIYQVQSDPHEAFDPYLLAGMAVRELNAHNYHAEVLPEKPTRISTNKPIDNERFVSFFNRGIELSRMRK